MNTCKGCGQRIIWLKTKNGRNMPCDPDRYSLSEIDEDGLLFLDEDEETKILEQGLDGKITWAEVERKINELKYGK